MNYIEISTGLIFSLEVIRLRHPNVSIPDGADLTDMGYVPAPLQGPPAWGDANLDPRYYWIDKGPFIDRLGIYGYAGLKDFVLGAARTNDVCYGLLADLGLRAYVDLKGRRAELMVGLGRVAQVAAAVGMPAFTPDMRAAVLDSRTLESERHIKGLIQPQEA